MAEMSGPGHKEQQQGHQQLLPLLPPAAHLAALRQGRRGIDLLPAARRVTNGRQAGEQRLQRRRIELHPGGALQQVDTDLMDAWMLLQAGFDGADAATAAEALQLEQHRLGVVAADRDGLESGMGNSQGRGPAAAAWGPKARNGGLIHRHPMPGSQQRQRLRP